MTTSLPPSARNYVDRLRKASRSLPRRVREELASEIEQHVLEALAQDSDDADVRAVLEKLGSPEEIVRAVELGSDHKRRTRGWREWAAVILVPFGGIVLPVVGWLVGLAFLWGSDAWGFRDKMIGTLAPPGGYLPLASFALWVNESRGPGGCRPADANCPSGREVALTTQAGLVAIGIFLTVLPLCTSIYLARRARTTNGG